MGLLRRISYFGVARSILNNSFSAGIWYCDVSEGEELGLKSFAYEMVTDYAIYLVWFKRKILLTSPEVKLI